MLDPAELYRLEPDAPELAEPVLVMVLDGFVDAGAAARLAADSMLASGSGQRVVRFDVDQLVDYRSRRPPLRFETDHWEHYTAPELDVVALTDSEGTGYLLLTGPGAGHAVGAVRGRRRGARPDARTSGSWST